jgi:hypothetical protein
MSCTGITLGLYYQRLIISLFGHKIFFCRLNVGSGPKKRSCQSKGPESGNFKYGKISPSCLFEKKDYFMFKTWRYYPDLMVRLHLCTCKYCKINISCVLGSVAYPVIFFGTGSRLLGLTWARILLYKFHMLRFIFLVLGTSPPVFRGAVM